MVQDRPFVFRTTNTKYVPSYLVETLSSFYAQLIDVAPDERFMRTLNSKMQHLISAQKWLAIVDFGSRQRAKKFLDSCKNDPRLPLFGIVSKLPQVVIAGLTDRANSKGEITWLSKSGLDYIEDLMQKPMGLLNRLPWILTGLWILQQLTKNIVTWKEVKE